MGQTSPRSEQDSKAGAHTTTDASKVELPAFEAAECHVHVRIPPCTTLGHRADAWNVEQPDYTVQLRAVTRGDAMVIRLLINGAETFAEAVWDADRPMTSVIDAAVDSSRYFALRIDNAATRQHVWIGTGFSDRETASQLKLSLSEHARYLARRAAALQRQCATAARDATGSSAAAHHRDLALRSSITVQLPNKGAAKAGDGLFAQLQRRGSAAAPLDPSNCGSAGPADPFASFKFHPPPESHVATRMSGVAGHGHDRLHASDTARLPDASHASGTVRSTVSGNLGDAEGLGHDSQLVDDDAFGDFVGTA